MGLFVLTVVYCGSSMAQPPKVQDVTHALKSADFATAKKLAIDLDDAVLKGETTADTATLLALVARTIEQSGDAESASELYERAVDAVRRPAADLLAAKQIMAIYLAAGSNLARAGKCDYAIDAFKHALQFSEQMSARQRESVGQLLMLLGSESLTQRKPQISEKAYQLAMQHVAKEVRPTCQLGLGWAISMQDDRQADAVEALTQFIDGNPKHPDAARAAELCIRCCKHINNHTLAEKLTSKLLTNWPSSQPSLALMEKFSELPLVEIPDSAKAWLRLHNTPKRIAHLELNAAIKALLLAVEEENSDLVDPLTNLIAARDTDGAAMFDVLQSLNDMQRTADAERIVAMLVSPPKDTRVTAPAREIACQWAGRQQLWSMLALASESSEPNLKEKSRTPAVERLFAESLMQVGRPVDAKVWWDHLVDFSGADDFATLLRCAETSTAMDDIKTARKRIDQARDKALSNAGQHALVDMLNAELSVRELNFEQARRTLALVVRSNECPAGLRARAQWTIGETFFMQQQYANAIESYRLVESIDPNGDWIAVSLVQAGKSFEQLARTREAAVCYSTLISRYADGPYAAAARKRLALIAPESNPPNDTLRR